MSEARVEKSSRPFGVEHPARDQYRRSRTRQSKLPRKGQRPVTGARRDLQHRGT
jgi:hypothetical protein